MSSTYENRKAAGLCTRCKNKALPGKVRCQTCTEITADYVAGRRDIWKLKGLCSNCGKRPPAARRKECSECLRRDAETRAARAMGVYERPYRLKRASAK
jgi:predicted amidophosphoribosyltransferase